MDKILIFIALLFSTAVNGMDVNSVGVLKVGGVTKLLPEIKGLDFSQGYFGSSIAIENNYMVVGAPNSSYGGAIAVYEKVNDQWVLMQMMDTASMLSIGRLGNSVDIAGGIIYVGAEASDLGIDGAGAILVFELINGKWERTRSILSPDPVVDGQFGANLNVEGDLAVVTEIRGFNQSGLFYVYDISGDDWQLSTVIDDMDLEAQAYNWSLEAVVEQSHVVLSRSRSGSSSALVRVYDRTDNSWQTYQEFQSPVQSRSFGDSVSMNGNQMVIADSGLNSNRGAVYYYLKNNGQWNLEQTLVGPIAEPDKEFGSSVQLNNDHLLIGSYGDDDIAGAAGALYYYQKVGDSWQQQQKLLASEGAVYDRFGIKSELGDDEIIISAYYADSPTYNSGKVYSFKLIGNSWSEDQIIEPLTRHNRSLFSNALALNDDWIMVGADGDSDQGDEAGAVYIFAKQGDELVFVEKLYAQQAASDQQFGKKIILQDDKMLIGATGNTVIDGYVHYYRLTGGQWVFQEKFKPQDTLSDDYFGYAMSLSGDLLAVSAISQVNGDNSGAVYLFELVGDDWFEQSKIQITSSQPASSIGYDLSLSGNQLVIGSLINGVVFVVEEDQGQWQQTDEIMVPDGYNALFFGRTVRLFNDQLIVANQYSPLIYQYDGSQFINPTEFDTGGNNGVRYFDAKDNLLVLNMAESGSSASSKSFVYQYTNDTWQYVYELPKPPFRSFYSNDIIIHNNEVLMGDYSNNQRGEDAGAAYWIRNVGDLIYQDRFESASR